MDKKRTINIVKTLIIILLLNIIVILVLEIRDNQEKIDYLIEMDLQKLLKIDTNSFDNYWFMQKDLINEFVTLGNEKTIF